jgi:hypothetical protein
MATRPAGTTDAMWWFWQQVYLLEKQAQLSGTRVYKTGYHGPVDWMQANHPNDYSIQRAADLRGPRTVGRAIDLSYADARAGRTLEHKRTIIRVTKRVAAAVERKDPRMYGPGDVAKVREVIGTLDGRNTHLCSFLRERVTTRTYDPDDSHLWHNHVSVTTEYVNDPQTYRDLLDIMFGDLIQEDDMPITDADAVKIAKATWDHRREVSESARTLAGWPEGFDATAWNLLSGADAAEVALLALARSEAARDLVQGQVLAAVQAAVGDRLSPEEAQNVADLVTSNLVRIAVDPADSQA